MKDTRIKDSFMKDTVRCSVSGEQVRHPATHYAWIDIRKVRLARG